MRHPFPLNVSLSLTTVNGGSVRQHLAQQLRNAILTGSLAEGDPLPSTRSLATSLGIARGTVISVYEDLGGEGYVELRPGSGTFVARGMGAVSALGIPDPPRIPDPQPQSPRAQPAIVDLCPGQPSTRLGEDRAWRAAWRLALRQTLPTGDPESAGIWQVRERIAAHLRSARGLRCTPEEILITAGTSDGLALLAHVLTQRTLGPRIALEDPGYTLGRLVLERCGVRAVPIRLHDGGLNVAELARTTGMAAVMVTPSHQYPLGGSLSIASRLSLVEWAAQQDAIIIEDDYDSEFRHGAPPLPAIASLDTAGRVVLVGSFSKSLAPSLRCGYLVVQDAVLRAELLQVRAELGQPVAATTQLALAEFIDSDGLKRHLMRAGREYAHRRRLVMTALEPLAPTATLRAIEGGLHAAVTWHGRCSGREVAADLEALGIRVNPLSYYRTEDLPESEQGIVFGYGGASDVNLARALSDIATVLTRRLHISAE